MKKIHVYLIQLYDKIDSKKKDIVLDHCKSMQVSNGEHFDRIKSILFLFY